MTYAPAAPHPFRRRIVFAASPSPRRGITAQDVREFLMAYCACFVAVSAYIA
jgi:hypothetical protein